MKLKIKAQIIRQKKAEKRIALLIYILLAISLMSVILALCFLFLTATRSKDAAKDTWKRNTCYEMKVINNVEHVNKVKCKL